MASLASCPGGDTRARGNWISSSCCEYTGEKGYIGLSFQIDGEAHYGWAHLSVEVNPLVRR